MYHFFDWRSIQHIPIDEYSNLRYFKVSSKDTKTIFLLTLNIFHTSFVGSN